MNQGRRGNLISQAKKGLYLEIIPQYQFSLHEIIPKNEQLRI